MQDKPTIADQITKATNQADKTLESVQNSAAKLGGRILKMMGLLAIGIVLAYQGLVGFQSKTKDVWDKPNVEKLDEHTTKIKGRRIFTVSRIVTFLISNAACSKMTLSFFNTPDALN